MTELYRDYFWKNGIPYGIQKSDSDVGYKIVMDPYRKRIGIERYRAQALPEPIYDSAYLDFRHLKHPEQTAWQKNIIRETKEEIVCLIRDQNDRSLFVETHLFQGDFCRECRVTTLYGTLLSVHKMFYIALNDSFDGVCLFDAHAHPVMRKRYLFDRESHQFTELLEEQWEIPPV